MENKVKRDPFRVLKKRIRSIFRKYFYLTKESFELIFKFFYKRLDGYENLPNEEEMQREVIRQMKKEHSIKERNNLYLLKNFKEKVKEVPEELLIIHFHLYLIQEHIPFRIQLFYSPKRKRQFIIQMDNRISYFLVSLPSLSLQHSNYRKEASLILEKSLNNRNPNVYYIFLFNSKDYACRILSFYAKRFILQVYGFDRYYYKNKEFEFINFTQQLIKEGYV